MAKLFAFVLTLLGTYLLTNININFNKELTMFLKRKKRGGKSFMKMFIQEWKLFFKELGKSLSNLWKRYCPKLCKCNVKKEK